MLKRIIIVLLAITFLSCSKKHRPVITSKWNKSFAGRELSPGICVFYYRDGTAGATEFIDSCNKYNVGDTIYPSNH